MTVSIEGTFHKKCCGRDHNVSGALCDLDVRSQGGAKITCYVGGHIFPKVIYMYEFFKYISILEVHKND